MLTPNAMQPRHFSSPSLSNTLSLYPLSHLLNNLKPPSLYNSHSPLTTNSFIFIHINIYFKNFKKMSSVCSEQHKLLLSLKKSLTLRDINDISDLDIPPRKLLTRRTTTADMFSDDDPYSSDHFRMFEFKIRRCTRSRSHDWTDCPFAHPGEKARRRDPRRFQYSGEVCPEYRRGNCSRGDTCEFSHGVFECYLHPSRYRTEACKDGKNCKRKVCFFAHTPRQLRVLPPPPSPSQNNNNNNHCCSFCHCSSNSSYSTCSPTSTLFGMSHFTNSPPMSPSSPPTSSRFSKEMDVHVLNELMCSLELEAMNSPTVSRNFPWFDVSDSPSAASASSFSPTLKFSNSMKEERKVVVDDVMGDPDFGWVNDLLMN